MSANAFLPLKAIRALINSDDNLRRKFAILVSIPGIAERSAFALLIDMPELGTLEAQEAAALSGTAPMTRQSGKRTGKAFVSGGRVNVRRALYMPALVAARFNPDLRDKYKEFTARGKPPKVAITAIMRKLVILANALIRDDREWSPRVA
jgi:transposase